MPKPKTCTFLSPWGRCQQPQSDRSTAPDKCEFHAHWLFVPGEPDRYYHEKVCRGLVRPLGTELTPEEIRATMGETKYHGDGRRLDAYVIEDPVS